MFWLCKYTSVTWERKPVVDTETNDAGEWVSPREAGLAVGLPERTVRDWCERGRVPATQSDTGRWSVNLAALRSLVVTESAEQPPAAATGDVVSLLLENSMLRSERDALRVQLEVAVADNRRLATVARIALDGLAQFAEPSTATPPPA